LSITLPLPNLTWDSPINIPFEEVYNQNLHGTKKKINLNHFCLLDQFKIAKEKQFLADHVFRG
jgi:hypothetical protein